MKVHNTVQEAVIKTIPKKKKCKKAKWSSEEALQTAEKRREAKGKGEKERVGKEFACSAGDPGSIPGLGRSPGEGNGNPFQYPCLENLMHRGTWWIAVHGVAKSWA